VHIRKARPTDFKGCIKLDHSVSTEYAWRMEEQELEGGITVAFHPVRLPRQVHLVYPRQDEQLMAGWEGCDHFLIASNGRRVCAYVTARALLGHGLVWVQDLVVGPEWRRQGVGTQLVQETVSWAVDQGMKQLIIEVQTRNHPGVCFCRNLGLSFCGYNDRHWQTRDIALFFGIDVR
jgi:GNAT superfamily N-acetyltransferase